MWPSVFPSIRVFSNELSLHITWPMYLSFSISPSNEYSGLTSFRIDWFDLLASKELSSLPQHHNLKASILRHSAFHMVQFSHPYMTNGRTTALTIRTFVGQMRSLLFSILSRFVSFPFKQQVSFNSMAALTIHSDFGTEENKICHTSTFSPSICHEVMGPDAMILVF